MKNQDQKPLNATDTHNEAHMAPATRANESNDLNSLDRAACNGRIRLGALALSFVEMAKNWSRFSRLAYFKIIRRCLSSLIGKQGGVYYVYWLLLSF